MPQSGSSLAGVRRTGGLVPVADASPSRRAPYSPAGPGRGTADPRGLHVDVCDVSHFLFAASEENQQLEINRD